MRGKEMGWGDWILVALLALLLGWAVRRVIHDHKRGGSCGCGSCEGCTGCQDRAGKGPEGSTR